MWVEVGEVDEVVVESVAETAVWRMAVEAVVAGKAVASWAMLAAGEEVKGRREA